ncbi:Yip1 family protein [Piscinibacter sp.]|jgi:hypothetical protein|uniref:Yip1 family protein n=1 Tax=Piscinibacter sp. TaxID=1903157 RepID=UPI0035594C6A
MPLIQRVKDILLQPKVTWPVIAQESATTGSIYSGYVVFLAAIPAIASFIGLSLVGAGGFGFSVRVPVVVGLVHMIVGYGMSLVAVLLLALITDALAPTFGGSKSSINALKLVAYGSTAGFVGGVFNLIPSIGILGLLAALYSIYLIYTGVPVLMKCPPEKAGAYTAVVIVCGVVAMVVFAAVSSLMLPSGSGMRFGGMRGMMGGGGDVTIKTPGGEIQIDAAKMEALSKRMEEAGKRMEQAQASGDSAAAGKAMGDIMGAMTGTSGTPIAAQDLKALLPEALGELKRESFEAQGGQAMGMAGSSAKASYAAGDKRVQLSITDMGGMAGLAALAGWANMTSERETSDEIEKVYKQGPRTLREEFRKDGSRAELTVILGNGVIVEAKGDRVEMAALKGAVNGMSLDKLEAMKRSPKQ